MDGEISQGRKIAFERIFQDKASFLEVEEGFVEFSTSTRRFGGYDVLGDRGVKEMPMLGGQLMGQHALFYNN
jgi:hypothetical protein